MYLKSFQMKNFRKYREENNVVMFVNSEGIRGKKAAAEAEENKDKPQIDVASATTLIVGKNNAGKTSIIHALMKIIKNNETEGLQVSDFNFHYLKECFHKYQAAYISWAN